MKATVTSKGQVTIPCAIRNQAKIVEGSQLDFQFDNNGNIIVHLVNRDILDLKGIIKTKRKKPVSLNEMKKAISSGASKGVK